MSTFHSNLAKVIAIIAVLLASCKPGPTPTPTLVPTRPQATLQPEDTLPPDAWFSIRAKGRVSPTISDVVIVYQNGLAVCSDAKTGKQYQKRLDSEATARWQRMLNQANIAALKNSYLMVTPDPEDQIQYVFLYRQDGEVKIVAAQMMAAPPGLQNILGEFWNFLEEIQLTS